MSSAYFRFHDLGLNGNPFRALEDDEWAQAAVLPPPVEEALTSSEHLQLLGPQGRGKSTLLRGIALRLREADVRTQYEYLPLGQRRYLTDPTDLDALLLDEAQRLWPWQTRRLLAHAGMTRLLISSHRDLSRLFHWRGLPLQTVRVGAASTPDHIAAILQRRLQLAALDDHAPLTIAVDAVTALHNRFGDDLRAMEFYLYDIFELLRARGAAALSDGYLTANDLDRLDADLPPGRLITAENHLQSVWRHLTGMTD